LFESQCLAGTQQPSIWRNSATEGSPGAHRDYREGWKRDGPRPAEPYIKDGLICDSSALTLQNPVF
jgi:hypothetical protein